MLERLRREREDEKGIRMMEAEKLARSLKTHAVGGQQPVKLTPGMLAEALAYRMDGAIINARIGKRLNRRAVIIDGHAMFAHGKPAMICAHPAE